MVDFPKDGHIYIYIYIYIYMYVCMQLSFARTYMHANLIILYYHDREVMISDCLYNTALSHQR